MALSSAAGDYSARVMGTMTVFVETDKADFNEILKVFSGATGAL